jgi:hypothetical protein
MGSRRHALAGLGGGEAGAEREPAAERLGQCHDVRHHAGVLIGEQVAGAPHPGLHLVEHEQKPMLVAERAQRPQELVGHHPHSALAHHRLDQDGGGGRTDGAFGCFEIAERHLVEAVDHRAEAVEIFLLPAGRERRQRPAVECALIRNNTEPLRVPVRGVELARGLDRALHCLGAGVAEERQVGKARRRA